MFPTLIVEPALCFTVSLWALAARGILHSTCAHTCKLRNFILFLYNLIGLQMLHAFYWSTIPAAISISSLKHSLTKNIPCQKKKEKQVFFFFFFLKSLCTKDSYLNVRVFFFPFQSNTSIYILC